MKTRISNMKTLLLAAGSVLAVGTAIAVAKRIGAQSAQQFVLFQELAAGEDALDVAKQLMGPEVIEHAGFFSTTFRVPGNSGLVGMIS